MSDTKHDLTKEQYSQIPWNALKEVAKLSTHGSRSYSPGAWKKCEDVNIWLDAAMRHFQAHMSGKLYDDEGPKPTGMLHLTCVNINIMFAVELLLKTNPGSVPSTQSEEKVSQPPPKKELLDSWEKELDSWWTNTMRKRVSKGESPPVSITARLSPSPAFTPAKISCSYQTIGGSFNKCLCSPDFNCLADVEVCREVEKRPK